MIVFEDIVLVSMLTENADVGIFNSVVVKGASVVKIFSNNVDSKLVV